MLFACQAPTDIYFKFPIFLGESRLLPQGLWGFRLITYLLRASGFSSAQQAGRSQQVLSAGIRVSLASQGIKLAFCFSSHSRLPGGDERCVWGVFRFANVLQGTPLLPVMQRRFHFSRCHGGWGVRVTMLRAEVRLARRQAGSLPGVGQCPTSSCPPGLLVTLRV